MMGRGVGPGWSLQGEVHAVREGHALEEKKSKNEVYKRYGMDILYCRMKAHHVMLQ